MGVRKVVLVSESLPGEKEGVCTDFWTRFVRSHTKLQSGPIRPRDDLSPLSENAEYIRLSDVR